MSYIYLAQPYTHANSLVVTARARIAEFMLAYYAKRGEVLYAPIVQWHAVAQKFDLPTDAAHWNNDNKVMVENSSELRVLRMPKWEESKGLKFEMELAESLNLKIIHIEWAEIYRECEAYEDKFGEYPFEYWLDILTNKS